MAHRTKSPEKYSRWQKLTASALIGPAAVVSVGLLSSCSSASEKSPRPSTSEISKPPVDPLNPNTVISSKLYDDLPAAEKTKIDKYHSMTPEQFKTLPEAERASYANFLLQVYGPYAIQQIPKVGGNLFDVTSSPIALTFADTFKPFSETSPSQSIFNYIALEKATAFWMMAEKNIPWHVRQSNHDDAVKLIDGIYSDAGLESLEYTLLIKSLDKFADKTTNDLLTLNEDAASFLSLDIADTDDHSTTSYDKTTNTYKRVISTTNYSNPTRSNITLTGEASSIDLATSKPALHWTTSGRS